MKTTWDYTKLADAYIKRPNYSSEAIDNMCNLIGLTSTSTVCDMGAGVAHLTIELGRRGMHVIAVEPNDAMRQNGINRTKEFLNVKWEKGTGEKSNQKDAQFDAITFGSSFNVCDQLVALHESFRICKPAGWFSCMWNHRDLNDDIQHNIEMIIKKNLPSYEYGLRRQDQMPILKSSGLFQTIEFLTGNVCHQQTITECVEAWRSHGTLYRQTQENDDLFNKIITDIQTYLTNLDQQTIKVPYVTRIWAGKFRN